MRPSESRTKTIAFYKPRGGVGTTTLAAFACILATNDGVSPRERVYAFHIRAKERS